MNGLFVLDKLSPKGLVVLMKYLFPLSLLLRYLFTSVFGSFFLVSIFYAWAYLFFDSQPYGPAELALWMDGLEVEAKTAVATSLLTILGFMVAFNLSTTAWKDQTFAQIKLTVANELEEFFLAQASRLATDLMICAKNIAKAARLFEVQGKTSESDRAISVALRAASEYQAKRAEFSRLVSEVHRMSGTHRAVLGAMPHGVVWLNRAIAAFNEIGNQMWLHIPQIDPSHPNLSVAFVYEIDPNKFEEFAECCDSNTDIIAGIVGAIAGALRQAVIPVNFATYLNTQKMGSDAVEIFSLLARGKPM